jgi:hypothetical protein
MPNKALCRRRIRQPRPFWRRRTASSGMDEVSEMLLFDPQTSGGLLMAVPDPIFDRFTARAAKSASHSGKLGAYCGSGIEIIA